MKGKVKSIITRQVFMHLSFESGSASLEMVGRSTGHIMTFYYGLFP